MLGLTDATRWRAVRAGYLQAARECKACLINPDGPWGYAPDDERVKKALGFWLHRARNAHAFANARKPVIANFIAITNTGSYTGPLYATARQESV